MLLYHFTSTMHLPVIEAAGFLKVTDANLFRTGPTPQNPNEPIRGDKVVWLLDQPETAMNDNGLKGAIDKSAVRITVDVPDAQLWLKWLTVRKRDDWWVQTTIRTGGGKSAAKHWWVVGHPIPRSQWTEIRTPEGTRPVNFAAAL